MIETTEAAELEQFETFLKTFKKKKYAGETSRLIALGARSLVVDFEDLLLFNNCLLYTSPSPRDQRGSRMPSSA